MEIEMFRRSGAAHTKAYEQIPSVYQPGMTDRQLSVEIERLMRLEGCLGIFRVFGQSMEIFMGSLLAVTMQRFLLRMILHWAAKGLILHCPVA